MSARKRKGLWPEALVWDEPDGSIGVFCWSEEQAAFAEFAGNLAMCIAEVDAWLEEVKRHHVE